MDLVDWILISGLVPMAAFVIMYGATARWWKNEVGRNIMAFAFVETGFLVLAVLRRIFGDNYWGRQEFAFAFFAVMVIIAWNRLYILVKTQVLYQRERKAKNSP